MMQKESNSKLSSTNSTNSKVILINSSSMKDSSAKSSSKKNLSTKNSQVKNLQVKSSPTKYSSARKLSVSNRTVARTKAPLYVQIVCDLCIQIPNIDIFAVAQKYNRTPDHIKWILSKSIKRNLPSLWRHITARLKNQQVKDLPQYVQIAAHMYSTKSSIDDTAKVFNKTSKQVYDALRLVKTYLGAIYRYIDY